MFMGFIGLLKVAITQWIQVSGEHEAALKTSHLSPCVVGIREKNINEEPFLKLLCRLSTSFKLTYFVCKAVAEPKTRVSEQHQFWLDTHSIWVGIATPFQLHYRRSVR